MSEQGSGLKVKFGPRGRTYTQKDFREMPDDMLLGKVIVFAHGLPWRAKGNRDTLLTMLSRTSAMIRAGEKKTNQGETKDDEQMVMKRKAGGQS